jgi:hypothetical protein
MSRHMSANITNETALKNIRLFADRVMPQFR